ncbi:MAG TPA: VOC family protein [Polyangia bacterium]|nr:VOC family protein [Polyangia bacterium]
MGIAEKDPPRGWPRLSVSIACRRAAEEIDFLRRAFGFEVQLEVKGEGGRVQHAELVLGGALVTLGDVDRGRAWRKSPLDLGGANTQACCLYVDDVDAHCARARAAGAVIDAEPKTTDHGEGYWVDRSYCAIDPEGHHWWFMQRLGEHPRGGR